jgi:hypothetical protein
LDIDGAVIYESVADLLEPALGAGTIGAIKIPYLSYHPRVTVKSGGSLPFKKILTNPPAEIYSCLRYEDGISKNSQKWSGKFDYEIISAKLADF